MPCRLCLRAWRMWGSGWSTTGFSSTQAILSGFDILDLLVHGSFHLWFCANWGFSWTHNSCLKRRRQPWLRGPLQSLRVVISCTHSCTRGVAAHGHTCYFDIQSRLLQCVLCGAALEEYLEDSTDAKCNITGSYWCQLLATCDTAAL